MIINPRILRRDMINLLTSVDDQITEVKKEAERLGIPPETMRDSTGNWVMIPLLAAKVQGLAALAQLNNSSSS